MSQSVPVNIWCGLWQLWVAWEIRASSLCIIIYMACVLLVDYRVCVLWPPSTCSLDFDPLSASNPLLAQSTGQSKSLITYSKPMFLFSVATRSLCSLSLFMGVVAWILELACLLWFRQLQILSCGFSSFLNTTHCTTLLISNFLFWFLKDFTKGGRKGQNVKVLFYQLDS